MMLERDLRACGTIKITSQILEVWGVSFEEVYHKAYLNLIKEEAIIKSMAETLSELGCNDWLEPENVPMMYILTNTSHIHGATMMLRDTVFKELTEKFESDLVVIPSSIHELLLVPIKNLFIFYQWQFNEMVQMVNREQVDPMEILSDHVYLYRRNDGWYNFK